MFLSTTIRAMPLREEEEVEEDDGGKEGDEEEEGMEDQAEVRDNSSYSRRTREWISCNLHCRHKRSRRLSKLTISMIITMQNSTIFKIGQMNFKKIIIAI